MEEDSDWSLAAFSVNESATGTAEGFGVLVSLIVVEQSRTGGEVR